MQTKQTIKLIKEEIRSLLHHFASEELQKKMWIEEKEKYVFFPTEFICMWHDDIVVGENPFKLVRDGVLSNTDALTLQSFNEVFFEFADKHCKKEFDYHPEQLLDYSPWLKVRQKARETLEKLGWEIYME